MTRSLRVGVVRVLLAALASSAVSLGAQQPSLGGEQRASRVQLTEQLAAVERQVIGARSADRARLQLQVSTIKTRLTEGDFRPGDRFVMTLRQDSVRSDTLVVRDSLRVAVLNLPELSVAGVLRSELEDKLTAHVGRFLRNAEVRLTHLTRVSVTGAVRNPGFYYAAPDRPINDLLTSAGGPAGEADLGKITVSRVGQTIIKGKTAKRAVEDGQTLESLDIQSGDTVHIPLKRKLNWEMLIRLLFIFTSLMFALLQFAQWYYGRQDN